MSLVVVALVLSASSPPDVVAGQEEPIEETRPLPSAAARRAFGPRLKQRITSPWSSDQQGCPEQCTQSPPSHDWTDQSSAKLVPELAALTKRQPIVSGLLGGTVGFGTGFYYAGDPNQGLVWSGIDSGLAAGLAISVVLLNQLVVANDFRTGLSLKRNERTMGVRERQRFSAGWVMLALNLASRLYQGLAGVSAANATNRALDGIVITPIDAAVLRP